MRQGGENLSVWIVFPLPSQIRMDAIKPHSSSSSASRSIVNVNLTDKGLTQLFHLHN